MKKITLPAIALVCALAFTTHAAPRKKKELTEDQKAVKKEMVKKYDLNKDGKLDKEELAKMSEDDKARMDKAGLSHKQKKAENK